MPETIHETKDYVLRPARYAKGSVALTVLDDQQGNKGRASRLAEGLGAQWSHREGAYIMSASKGRRFIQLFADRFDSHLKFELHGAHYVLDQKPSPIRTVAMKRQVQWLKPVTELGKVTRASKCGRYRVVSRKTASTRKGSFTQPAYDAQRADGSRIGRDRYDLLSEALDTVEMDNDPDWEPGGKAPAVPRPLVCTTCRSHERKGQTGGLARYTCRGCGRVLCHHLASNVKGQVGSCISCRGGRQ